MLDLLHNRKLNQPNLSNLAAPTVSEQQGVDAKQVFKPAFTNGGGTSWSELSRNNVHVSKLEYAEGGNAYSSQLPAFQTSMPTFTNVIDQHRFINLNRTSRTLNP